MLFCMSHYETHHRVFHVEHFSILPSMFHAEHSFRIGEYALPNFSPSEFQGRELWEKGDEAFYEECGLRIWGSARETFLPVA